MNHKCMIDLTRESPVFNPAHAEAPGGDKNALYFPPEVVTDQPRTEGVPVHVEQSAAHDGHSPGLRSAEKLSLGQNPCSLRGKVEPEEGSLRSQAQEATVHVEQPGPSEPGTPNVNAVPPPFATIPDFITDDFRARRSVHSVEVALVGHRGRELAAKTLGLPSQAGLPVRREVNEGSPPGVALRHKNGIAHRDGGGRIHGSEHACPPWTGIVHLAVLGVQRRDLDG